MPRVKGSGALGPVRSLRLPLQLDRWLEERLREDPKRATSDVLLQFVVGGLRLRAGYMARHYAALAQHRRTGNLTAYSVYWEVLRDTFGDAYMAHLQAWIEDTERVTSETSISS